MGFCFCDAIDGTINELGSGYVPRRRGFARKLRYVHEIKYNFYHTCFVGFDHVYHVSATELSLFAAPQVTL